MGNPCRSLYDKYWSKADLGFEIISLWNKFSKPMASLRIPLGEALKNDQT